MPRQCENCGGAEHLHDVPVPTEEAGVFVDVLICEACLESTDPDSRVAA